MSNRRALRTPLVAAVVALLVLGSMQAARAVTTVHVSFKMLNPRTGLSAGAGTRIRLFQVDRLDTQMHTTDANGVAAFDLAPTMYVLDIYCDVCGVGQGTKYLVEPQVGGAVTVRSAADMPVTQDGSGNWLLTTEVPRSHQATGDPWQLLPVSSVLSGSPEHMYLMTNGQVLIQTRAQNPLGGDLDAWAIYSPDATGDYAHGTYRAISSPSAGYNPSNMNGAVLHNGDFLVVGGEQNTNASGQPDDDTNQSYIYSTATGHWTPVAPPSGAAGDWPHIGASPFVELADGRVMVAHNGSTNSRGPVYSALYDQVSGTWTQTGLDKQSANQEQGYTLMANDKVLDISSGDVSSYLTEIYDPATGHWTQGADVPVVLGHSEIGPAIQLPSGKVLAMGATGHNALYDPTANSWSAVPDFERLSNGLQLAASDNPAAVLPNGNVLVQTSVFLCATANCYWTGPARWYEYDWQANTWDQVLDGLAQPASASIANGTNSLVLPTGQVMVTEGGRIELYTSTGTAAAGWEPAVTTLSSTSLSAKTTYTVTGTRMAGLTQGTFWGDEQQNATNYGLVRITNNRTRHVVYAKVVNQTSTSIAPSAQSSLSFSFPATAENGASTLEIVANGVPSAAVSISVSGYSPTISKGSRFALRTLAIGLGLSVPSKAVFQVRIAAKSRSKCLVVGVALKGLKRGSCAFTIAVKGAKSRKFPKATRATVTIG